MSKVTLTIGPKSYTVACADGEERRRGAFSLIGRVDGEAEAKSKRSEDDADGGCDDCACDDRGPVDPCVPGDDF